MAEIAPADFLRAARVPPTVHSGEYGRWLIRRAMVPDDSLDVAGWPTMTLLHRLPDPNAPGATGYESEHFCVQSAEVVMEDSKRELSRHLPIWLAAHGRVLVTGLGLGCVVRGLLASPRVEFVDVVEIDQHIIDAVGAEFAASPRCRVHLGDALTKEWASDERWDFAWHDIWADRAAGQPHLHLLHAQLLARYHEHVPRGRQGAWMFPRQVKNRLRGGLLGGKRREAIGGR